MKIILKNISCKLIISGADLLRGNVEKDLREYMRYKPDGYARTQAFKKKQWDGYNNLIGKTGKFATGFLPTVLAFLKPYELTIEIVDERKNIPKFKKGPMNWDLPEYSMAKHQKGMIAALRRITLDLPYQVKWRRGIWNAATNSGKTAAAAVLLQNLQDPVAIMFVADQTIYFQHIKFYNSIFGEENVGRIGPNKPKGKTVYEPRGILTIAMVGTTYNFLKKDIRIAKAMLNGYNVKIYDESHEASASQAVYVLNHIDAGMTLFMSGTPLLSSDISSKMKIIGLCGNEIFKVSKKYLMDIGFSMKPIIRMYSVGHRVIAYGYDNEKAIGILESKIRAELVADLIHERPGKKILIAFDIREHGEFMYTTLLAKYPQYMMESDWVHGTDNDRILKIQNFLDGKTRILFTSTIMQQGVNDKYIQSIIYTIAGKAAIGISQFMGRGERLDGVDTEFEWIDFFDYGKYLSRHSRLRVQFYKNEELEINYMYEADRRGTPKKAKN